MHIGQKKVIQKQFRYPFFLFLKIQDTLAANPNAEFKLFESHQYGESDLLFKDATRCLVHTSHLDYRSILGDEFYSHAEAVFNCTHSGRTFIKYICGFLKTHQRVNNASVYTCFFSTTEILEFCHQDACSMF